MSLQVKSLSKTYGKSVNALSDVTFSVEDGRVMGLLGRNGAGKTTTLKCLMGIIEFNGGEILFDGVPIGQSDMKIGYLPEERGLYLHSTVGEQLVFFANLNHIKRAQAVPIIHDYLAMFEIPDFYNRKVKTLSKGNKQKIQLISALLHNPELVILDEPFSGLDPVNAELFERVILNQKKIGKTILFSSHRMEDMEELCDNILMLKNGRVVVDDTIEGLIEHYSKPNTVLVKTKQDISPIIKSLGLTLEGGEDGEYQVRYRDEEQLRQFQRSLYESNAYIESYRHHRATLQNIFVKEMGEDEQEK